nr:NAD-dependent epimerase/dehydratase family protein [Blastococcus litoris]
MTKGRALVTGCAGFVGSTLVEQLLAATDWEVIGLDSLTDYYSPELKRRNLETAQKSDRFSFVHADLNRIDLAGLVQSVDHVFHQAGQPGVRSSWGTEFDIYIDSNISATQKLLEASRSAELKSFVYASSSSIYGDARAYPTRETDVPSPLSPYGATKLAAEHLCSLYAANFGVPTVSLRYFTVYGPRQRPDMAFTRLVRSAIEGRPFDVYGDGSQIREFTHVSDIVRANILAATAGLPPGRVINLSGGSSVSLTEVIDVVQSIHGSPLNLRYRDSLPGDVKRTGGSTELAGKLLGWRPEIQLQEGLKSQYDWAMRSSN